MRAASRLTVPATLVALCAMAAITGVQAQDGSPAVIDLASMPLGITDGTTFAHGGYVYYMGGWDGDEPSTRIVRYDPSEDRWTTLPQRIPDKQGGIQAAVAGDTVVVFGMSDAVLLFEPSSSSLETLDGALSQQRAVPIVVSDERYVYLMGGFAVGGGSERTEILRFDPVTRELVTLDATLPTGLADASAIWDGSHAYIFGGSNPTGFTSEILRFDPAAGEVESVGDLPQDLAATSAVWDGRFAYIFGGDTGREKSLAILRFDPETLETVTIDQRLGTTARSGTRATWLDGYAYVLGGHREGWFVPSDQTTRFDPTLATVDQQRLEPGRLEPEHPPESGDTATDPCQDLAACPVGDPDVILQRLRTTASRIVSGDGAALAGAPILFLASDGEALRPVGSTRTDEQGSFTAPPTVQEPPSHVAALLAGHVAVQEIAAQPSFARGDGLELPVPKKVTDSPLASEMTAADVAQLERSVEDARVFGTGPLPAAEVVRVDVGGYAGLGHVDLVVPEPAPSAQLVIVRLKDKGLEQIPDPPQGAPMRWFAVQLTNAEGEELPIAWMRAELVDLAGADPDRAVVNHFRLEPQGWEALTLTAGSDGAHTFTTRALSLFALAEVNPSTFATLVGAVADSPLTVPAIGVVLAGGLAWMAISRRRRRAGRPTATSPATDPAPATGDLQLPSVPEGAASLGPVDLPDDELSVSHLAVTLGGNRILDEVSFGLHKGQVLALLGPSGCGKSTTLNALIGDVDHDGDVDIFGLRPAADRAAIKRAVGFVAQDTQLYPDLTVRENVDYFGRQYGLDRRTLRESVPELLRTLGLDDRADTRVGVLSGGQQRRASIAATLVHSPALLVLDEPTSGLDPITRRNLWKFIKQANRDLGTSVIVTTHFLDEADLSDQVVILHRGRVVAQGSPDDLVRSLPGGGRAVVAELSAMSAAVEQRVREGMQDLVEAGTVAKIEFTGYSVRFFVSDPQRASQELMSRLNELDLPARTIATEACGMDDVFSHFAGEAWEEADR